MRSVKYSNMASVSTRLVLSAGMHGIVSYGAYLPVLAAPARAAIAAALGSGGAARAPAASPATTRTHVDGRRGRPPRARPRPHGASGLPVLFATTAPAYADKTNATAIHAALALADAPRRLRRRRRRPLGRRRACTLAQAARRPGRARRRPHRPARLAPTRRTAATPPSPSLFGDGPSVVAELVGGGRRQRSSSTAGGAPGERPRSSGRSASARSSTSRWPTQAVTEALKPAGLTADEVDHVVVAGLHARAVDVAPSGARRPTRGAASTTSPATVGNTGTAHAGARCWPTSLDRAEPGRDHRRGAARRRCRRAGCCAPPTRCAGWPARARRSPSRSPPARDDLSLRPVPDVARLPRPRSRRAGPTPTPGGAAVAATDEWKFGFVGSRDELRHRPPAAAAGVHGLPAPSTRWSPIAMADVPARSPPSPSTAWPTR